MRLGILVGLFLVLLAPAQSQSLKERLSNQKEIYYSPVGPTRCLLLLQEYEGSPDFSVLKEAFDLGDEIAVTDQYNKVVYRLLYEQDFPKEALNKLNDLVYAKMSDFMPTQFSQAVIDSLDPEVPYYYVQTSFQGFNLQSDLICTQINDETFILKFTILVSIGEHRPKKEYDKFYFTASSNVNIRIPLPEAATKSPMSMALDKALVKLDPALDKALTKIAATIDEKLPKKLSK